jgi:cytochrome c5
MQKRTAIALSAFAVAACADNASPAPGQSESAVLGNLPCNVQDIVKAKCEQCHAASLKGGAPMSLVTSADWQASRRGRPIVELATARINDTARPMPPSGLLDPRERALLGDWLAKGAPAAETTCGVAAPQAAEPPPCEADTMLEPSEPYAIGDDDDQYVCYGVDVEATTKKHVWAMVPHVDNATVLHHMLVFQSEHAVDPHPHRCDSFGAGEWKLFGGWAPGGGPIVLPAEAGYPENPGTTHWVLQVHYNNVSKKTGQKDRSGFGLCTTEALRKYDAGILAFGALKFAIPPRSDHSVTCDYTLDDRFRGVHFFSGSPHMHRLGNALTMDRLAADGSAPMSIIDAPAFNFENQKGSALSADVTTGDKIRTTCMWKNPGDAIVRNGEGTGAEMCFGFVGYYPAIPDQYTTLGTQIVPVFNWSTPSNNLPIMDTIREQTGLAIPSPTCHESP